ncbi:MAG: hypothetical protein MUE69_04120 [Myxococcota bacterium]|jgi:hypothetical protein|nr:hypothetical protein [Myxococcota bacterium]
MQAFRPSPPRDLISPSPDSSTARALVSLVRRTRFEAWKAYRPEGLALELTHDLDVLRAVFSHFLPGNPHAVAGVLALPGVGAALRRAVGGALGLDGTRALPDPSAIPELCTSALLALHVEGALPFDVTLRAAVDVAIPARDLALRGVVGELRLTTRRGELGGGTLAPLGVERFRVGVWLGEGSAVVDDALTQLETRHPGRVAELRRVALELIASDEPEHGFARRFGRVELSVEDVSRDEGRTLDVERVRHLLTALAEVDDLARDPAPLLRAALEGARGERVDADALSACGPTDVGRGVIEELRRARR